ncbi:MAG: ankyrin repeat domain-containing protein [Pseudomonadota bacterium]
MSTGTLPERANLEHLKNQAKALRKAASSGDGAAADRIGPYFGDPAKIALQQAQLVIAREYGFSSWTRLKRHVEAGAPRGETTDQRATRFLDLVSVHYGYPVPDFGPKRFEHAAALLAAHPEIADESIHVAAAIGDAARVSAMLDRNPDLIDAKGGFHHWPPLMYAAYGRLPGISSLPSAEVLIARGADPNAHYLWGGQYRFTALTGAFAQGEGGPINQPEHPEVEAFARLLLEAGADPNDGQAIYNTHFEPGDLCVSLLLEYGLAAEDRLNWSLREGESLRMNPQETMHFALITAIRRGYASRAKLLIDAGVDLAKTEEAYETRVKGHTPYEVALLMGETGIAAEIAAAGGPVSEFTGLKAYEAAVMAADVDRARVLAEEIDDPDAIAARQIELMDNAVAARKHAAIRAMIALDFPVSVPGQQSPLHGAAYNGDFETVRLFIDAGADTALRDPHHLSPPLGWAQHAGQTEMLAFLEAYPMDIFTAAARGLVERLAEMLDADPGLANQRFVAVHPPGSSDPGNGWITPIVSAATNDRTEAVRLLIERGADLGITSPEGDSLPDLIAREGHPETAAMIAAAMR